MSWSTERCLIIAEVAQAHDGSLGMAHAFVDAVAQAGADAIKFQTHLAEFESSPDEPWRVPFSPQDATRYDYWQRMSFTEKQWQGLKHHADERGLLFLSSPFSLEAVALLRRVGVSAWKVASGEVGNQPLLEAIAQTKQPVLLSSGMSDLNELDQAVAFLQGQEVPFYVLQCTSAYPCPPEKVGINMIPFFAERYACPVGLSDHSGTIYPGLAAVTLGGQVLEVHVTFSRSMFGPDVPASLTIEELEQLVEGVRFTEAMHRHPVDKNQIAQEFEPLRRTFTRSLVTTRPLPAGTILQRSDITFKKPGIGIPLSALDRVLGHRLKQDVPENTRLDWHDIVLDEES